MCPEKCYKKRIALVFKRIYDTLPMLMQAALILVFTIMIVKLPAQTQSEDYMTVKNWDLPENAIAMTELHKSEQRLYYEDRPFSGWAYELYPDGALMQATQYKDGVMHGLNLLWYQDGSPQMSAAYRDGSLHGRFLGWYLNGRVIYDMFINRGTYASDNLESRDDLRQEEAEIYEREGSTDDSTSE